MSTATFDGFYEDPEDDPFGTPEDIHLPLTPLTPWSEEDQTEFLKWFKTETKEKI